MPFRTCAKVLVALAVVTFLNLFFLFDFLNSEFKLKEGFLALIHNVFPTFTAVSTGEAETDVEISTSVKQQHLPQDPLASNATLRHEYTSYIVTGHAAISGQIFTYDLPKVTLTWEGIIFGVLSTARNRRERDIIRKTWGTKQQVLFLVAQPSNELYDELLMFDDLLIIHMEEGYRKICYKVHVLFYAVHSFIHNATLLFKTDDDSSINVPKLKQRLSDPNMHFWGNLRSRARPIRAKSHRWYVSYDQFNRTLYPPYCEGWGYAMSKQFLDCAVSRLPSLQYQPNEDVSTGILAEMCGVKATNGVKAFVIEHRIPWTIKQFEIVRHGVKHWSHMAKLYEIAEVMDCWVQKSRNREKVCPTKGVGWGIKVSKS